jgi:hypothetical protein
MATSNRASVGLVVATFGLKAELHNRRVFLASWHQVWNKPAAKPNHDTGVYLRHALGNLG